jgi:hypothetical protein
MVAERITFRLVARQKQNGRRARQRKVAPLVAARKQRQKGTGVGDKIYHLKACPY